MTSRSDNDVVPNLRWRNKTNYRPYSEQDQHWKHQICKFLCGLFSRNVSCLKIDWLRNKGHLWACCLDRPIGLLESSPPLQLAWLMLWTKLNRCQKVDISQLRMTHSLPICNWSILKIFRKIKSWFHFSFSSALNIIFMTPIHFRDICKPSNSPSSLTHDIRGASRSLTNCKQLRQLTYLS